MVEASVRTVAGAALMRSSLRRQQPAAPQFRPLTRQLLTVALLS
ncbi:hypothetical protein ACGF4C_14425 [Streptomyces sp. NPDC048197]